MIETGLGERFEPLFTSREYTRRIIDACCGVDSRTPLTSEQTELLFSRLRLQFWLAADKGEGRIGQTRFGGTPDLPEGASWPMRAAMPERARAAAASGYADTRSLMQKELEEIIQSLRILPGDTP